MTTPARTTCGAKEVGLARDKKGKMAKLKNPTELGIKV